MLRPHSMNIESWSPSLQNSWIVEGLEFENQAMTLPKTKVMTQVGSKQTPKTMVQHLFVHFSRQRPQQPRMKARTENTANM